MATKSDSTLGTWILVTALFLYFLAYSALAYFAIGDKGPPGWDFGVVKDVPGESPYSMYAPLPHPQHVRGKQGK